MFYMDAEVKIKKAVSKPRFNTIKMNAELTLEPSKRHYGMVKKCHKKCKPVRSIYC